jgi:glyoxylase-like metal-dependent hydrolase (beta-lactamase superfamily II)
MKEHSEMIIKQMTVGIMGVCCYIVSCKKTGHGVIIDPGGDEDAVLAHCGNESITVDYIINTHGHPDHVCGNAKIKIATNAKIVMHKNDADFFAKPEVDQFFSQLGLPASPPADLTVTDGDTLSFGKESLAVIHTPGHTPGGICLYSSPHLFTGDTLFVGAAGRTDFPGGSINELLAAIDKRLGSLPDDTIIWPGHGYGGERSTIGAEKKSNPFMNGSW